MSDGQDPADLGNLPDPPELPRRVRLYPPQWIGLPILFLLPVLAVLGFFGESRGERELVRDGFHITIDYPARLRAGQRTDLSVHLVNRSVETIRGVSVTWEPRLLHRFADVRLVPLGRDQPEWSFDVAPGEERIVRLELEGGELWRIGGYVAVTSERQDTLRAEIDTFVFP